MRRSTAAIGSAAYFAMAAGTFVVLIPWLVTGWQLHRLGAGWAAAGAVLIGAGLVPVVAVFVQFARAGGTPLPLAPTGQLVVSGFNRYVRNPIYLGSLRSSSGEALLFAAAGLLCRDCSGRWAGAAVFVRWYEEPALTRRFGAEYEAYRRAVPAWRPRLRPWTPGEPGGICCR